MIVCWVLTLLLSGAFSACVKEEAQAKLINGKITWLIKDKDDGPGQISCDKKHVLNGTDIAYCVASPGKDPAYVLMGNCIDNGNDKVIDFRGQKYEYHYVGLNEKTKKYPLTVPNTTYVITTEYTVSPNTPTVRVRVGLVGTAKNPVLVTIQQSTESVGFELPMRVEGKGGKALAPLTDHIVELCPLTLSKDDKGKPIPLPQTVQVTIRANEPIVKGNTKNVDVQVDFKNADHIDIIPDKWTNRYNLDERESLVYRYTWPVGQKARNVDEVDILVKWADKEGKIAAGKGPDVCASVSLRFGECPLETMGISGLTFTRQAFFTVNKHDKSIKNVKHANESFLIVMDVFPDDFKCRSSPDALDSPGRTKTVQILVTERKKESQVEFFILPAFTGLLIILIYMLVRFLVFAPQRKLIVETEAGDDSSLIDPEDSGVFQNAPPPFETSESEAVVVVKEVDLEEPCSKKDDSDEPEVPLGGGGGNLEGGPEFTSLADILSKVKRNDFIVHLQEAIGHNSIPVLIFLTQLPDILIDIKGNLEAYSLSGDLDACYTNSRCSAPANISDWRVPDISRVVSNVPYFFTAACFYLLIVEKSRIMRSVNAAGRGVKHDYGLFTALAVITGLVGITSSLYHVCANRTTSRADMFFIEILLSYFSLCLYQARNPNITSLFFVPAIVITILSALEQIVGFSWITWVLIAVSHILGTAFVGVQLFLLGRFTMSPKELWDNRVRVYQEIKENRKKPAFKLRFAMFIIGIASATVLGVTGAFGLWSDHTMYNVVAIVIDIGLYLAYYVINKIYVRRELVERSTVVTLVAATITWASAFLLFLSTKSTDTSLSPAESRAMNAACLFGKLDSHDLWHSLSSLAMFLTEILLLNMDDDQITVKTANLYF